MGAAVNQQADQFQAIPMSRQGATAAYPLVRLHDASVSLDTWLRFVRRHCGPTQQRTGLIAIRDCRGIVHALFSYRVDFDLHNRKRLCVANLIIAHIPGSKIEEAVATCTRNISAELGCHTISAEQPFRPATAPWRRCPTAEALTRRIGMGSRLH
jgi:hypothetical protein